MKKQEYGILDILGGAIEERVNREFLTICENIKDPNTNAKKARKLTITLEFKPDENRQTAVSGFSVKSTLQPMKPLETTLCLTNDAEGNPVAVEMAKQIAGQVDIYGNETPENKIIPLRRIV